MLNRGRYKVTWRGDGPDRDAEEERAESWRYERSRSDLFHPVIPFLIPHS